MTTVDFFTLFWLCIAAGVLAGGFGLALIAWHLPANTDAVYDLADAIRNTRTREEA